MRRVYRIASEMSKKFPRLADDIEVLVRTCEDNMPTAESSQKELIAFYESLDELIKNHKQKNPSSKKQPSKELEYETH
jgi:hypothetical protein